MGEKLSAGNAFVAGIRVREMAPDIAFSHCAQEGIDQSMEEDIRIRMAGQPESVRNLNPPENELPPPLSGWPANKEEK